MPTLKHDAIGLVEMLGPSGAVTPQARKMVRAADAIFGLNVDTGETELLYGRKSKAPSILFVAFDSEYGDFTKAATIVRALTVTRDAGKLMYAVTATGVLKKIETWQIIIPLHDNDGVDFPEETINSVREHIALTYPGLTMTNCTGWWRDSEGVHVDKNLQIQIDALPTEESAAFFAGLKDELRSRLRQEKIYVTKASKEEMLSFAEFFGEVGVETEPLRLAQQLVSRPDFVMRRSAATAM